MGRRRVTAVSVVVFDAIAFAIGVGPLLEGAEQWSLTVMFYLSWIALAVMGIKTMAVDPIDQRVDSSIKDPTNLHCYWCRSSVGNDSKHCWDCNKCVENFDHHC